MTTELDLERLSELADARLGVAEELGYAVAALSATAAQLAWSNWLVAAGAAIGAYLLATFRHRRAAAKAEDAYFAAARLGKYAAQSAPPK